MTPALTQLEKLEALIRAATLAIPTAARGDLWESVDGAKLTNAAFELFGEPGLYETQREIEFTCGITADGDRVLFIGDERRAA